MARLTGEGIELRRRLCGHLRRLYAEHGFETKQAMAEKLGVHKSHFGNLYNGLTEIGLDVAWKMHRVFGESLNHLCDDPAPDQFMPPKDGFLSKADRNPRRASRAR